MAISWKDLVACHRNPAASSDPQRATLRARAIAQVEEGLRHLASVGLSYEIQVKGAPSEMTTASPSSASLDLNSAIDQATVKPGPSAPSKEPQHAS